MKIAHRQARSEWASTTRETMSQSDRAYSASYFRWASALFSGGRLLFVCEPGLTTDDHIDILQYVGDEDRRGDGACHHDQHR